MAGIEFNHITVAIPAKCEGCGVQCELAAELVRLSAMKGVVEELGGDLVGEPGERFDATVEARVPEEVADVVKQGIRKSVSAGIGDLDSQIEDLKGVIDANALACGGLFKMRATKGGVTYTVSVCTSPRFYAEGTPTQLPTNILAEPESKQP
jgi:hypothetical protein